MLPKKGSSAGNEHNSLKKKIPLHAYKENSNRNLLYYMFSWGYVVA
jgi:hypothetical protein